MKVRNSFVTNSSSSSYVIAIKNNVSKSDIVKDLMECYSKNKSRFDMGIDSALDYLGETDLKYLSESEIEIYKAYQNKDETLVNKVCYMIADYLYGCIDDKKVLDSWNVDTVEFSNEDGEFISELLYDIGYLIKGEIIKLM